MRAQELAAPFPTVGMDTPAVEAARLMAGQNLPGLIAVMTRSRSPLVAVAGTDRPMLGVITLDTLLDRMLGT